MNLNTEYFGVAVSQWLVSLGVALGTAIVFRLVLAIAISQIRKIAKRTATDLDDLAVELLQKTRFLVILAVGLWAGLRPLDLPESWDGTMHSVLIGVLLLQVGFWGMGVISYLVGHYRKMSIEADPGFATAVGALGFVARFGLWVVLLLTALGTFGIEITPLLASLGVGGIAVALALQNVLGDLLASLSIVLDKPFVIGDFVVVGDFSGTVENVGLKTTRIRSLSGEQLVFSNSDLLSSRIRNFKRMDERRVVFAVGVEYGTPAEKLRKIPELVRAAVEAQDNARFDRSHFKGFGDFSLDFESVYFMKVPDYAAYMDTQQAINLELYERFAAEGVAFAFPTQTLHLVREEGSTEAEAQSRGAGPSERQ